MSAQSRNAVRPRFSLLVCTIGRTSELERLLASLCDQLYRSFEVVVVDQNPDDSLDPIIRRFSATLTVVRVRSAPGLSRARNVGLAYCTGEIVGFPDDDCWYAPDLLGRVACAFDMHTEIGFLTGHWLDENGRDAHYRQRPQGGFISVSDVWHREISFTIFCLKGFIEKVGGFDERLGVGAGTPWGAGEETDYLLRLMKAGLRGWHEPSCLIHHPRQVLQFDERAFRRALTYGRGTGFVLRKHAAGLPTVLRFIVRPLLGAVLSAASLRWRKARYHLLVARGRSSGFFGAPPRPL